MKIVSKDSFMSIRGTDMHQGYRHASGVQTCIRGTDMLQGYRHASGVQTCIRGTDMHQGYRHASGVQTCFRGTNTCITGKDCCCTGLTTPCMFQTCLFDCSVADLQLDMQAHPVDSHMIFAAAHTPCWGVYQMTWKSVYRFDVVSDQLQLLCIHNTGVVYQMSRKSTYLLEVVSDQLQLLRAEHEVLG